MDKSERIKLKQLAVDALTRPECQVDSPEFVLAEALEKAVDGLYKREMIPHCVSCICSPSDTNDR